MAFPANATPRPLVLTGAPVADPASGFPSGAAKLAYLEGAVNWPASLPSGPRSAAGFPLISAREACGVLKSAAATEHERDPAAVCAAVGYPRRVTVVLPAPLGGRVLVDAASGVAIAVTPAP